MRRNGALNTEQNQARLKLLPVSDIEEDPENERKQFSGMDELAASIERLGIIEPITVHASGDHYRIVTGHRRFRAAQALKQTHVEAVLMHNGDGKLRLRSLASNIQREALNPVEVARALENALQTELVKSQRELAAAIGRDSTWISGVLRIAKMDAELLSELEELPNPPPYDSVIRIARIKDKVQQKSLIEKLKQGATVKSIRRAIGFQQAKPRSGEMTVRTAHGFSATVTGPENDPERMLEAISMLIRKVRALSPSGPHQICT